jgi:hypothetical protein
MTAKTMAATTTISSTFMLLPLGSFGGNGALSVGTEGPGTTATGAPGSTGIGADGGVAVETGGSGADGGVGVGFSGGGDTVGSTVVAVGVSLGGVLFVPFSGDGVCCGSIT